jgi:transcription termination factor Rho
MDYLSMTKQQLEDLTIFELRSAGRSVGVASPASLNKASLIEKILNIASGVEKPSAPSKRGRPAKYVNFAPPQPENPAFSQTPAPVLSTAAKEFVKPPVEEKRVFKPFDHAPFPRQETVFTPLTEEEDIREGVLDIHTDGYGFIRVRNCEHSEKDVYVAALKIKKAGLRRGDLVKCYTKVNHDNKPSALIDIISINGEPPEAMERRPNFDDLVPIYPDKRLKLETKGSARDFAIRCIDLIAPIGKGQRAMIVSPPKAGKTTLLKQIAASISTNYPDVTLLVLLVDERPEEVTDMKRSIKGEVIYSTFDEMPEHHTKAAELLLSRAKRLVELGKDVVILMDSLTRLARAYNLTIPPTGRTLSGGIDPGALHSPKRFFGSARNIERGGSLTIIATALVDTGSRMDDVIYEEFKGTGNMEIHLDRKLSEKRIFPAIDLAKSGTRKEELLLTPKELEGIWAFRKVLSSGDTAEATETLLNMMVKTNTNQEFIEQLLLNLRNWQKEGFLLRKS